MYFISPHNTSYHFKVLKVHNSLGYFLAVCLAVRWFEPSCQVAAERREPLAREGAKTGNLVKREKTSSL